MEAIEATFCHADFNCRSDQSFLLELMENQMAPSHRVCEAAPAPVSEMCEGDLWCYSGRSREGDMSSGIILEDRQTIF